MRPMSIREEQEYLAYEKWCEDKDIDQSDDAWWEFKEEMEQAREDYEMELGERRMEARKMGEDYY